MQFYLSLGGYGEGCDYTLQEEYDVEQKAKKEMEERTQFERLQAKYGK